MSKTGESVKVCVRVRPMNSKEKQDGNKCIVSVDNKTSQITVKSPDGDINEQPKAFTFDAVFGQESQQEEVYKISSSDIVNGVLNGFNGTVFAYGQTGAGKSHTMEGCTSGPADNSQQKGIIPNSFLHIFKHVQSAGEDKKFLVYASYLEIYNEEIRDLLAKDPKNSLELKENIDSGVYVKDLTLEIVKDVRMMEYVMQKGKKNRSVAATLMNQTSSRSHSMFSIVIECASIGIDKKEHICVGKLNLVDLAGSERQSKTGATGDRLKEATKINLSLSALGNVISALVDGKSQHIPYRDSKLTRLLQDSLGGNAKTVMIANCGPADYNFDETLSTLRYANRAKNIKNKPKINEDPKDTKLREYQEEIARLKEQLKLRESSSISQKTDFNEKNNNQIPVVAPQKETEIREKLVEKVVIKREGVSEEELKRLEEEAKREKNDLKLKAKQEMKELLAQQSRTDEERLKLEKELQLQAQQKEDLEKERSEMLNKIKAAEEKLIIGGEILNKAQQQELELLEIQQKLSEQKKQEMLLAKELAEKEDCNLTLEEQHASIQEEVETKTKKLKKLWAKYKSGVSEINDLKNEFQTEREDIVDTIRDLNKQIKLKQLLINSFLQQENVQDLQKRVHWNDETNDWNIESHSCNLNDDDNSGNISKVKRPRGYMYFMSSAPNIVRIESLYTRKNREAEPEESRWKYENILSLELDLPAKATIEFDEVDEFKKIISSMDSFLSDPNISEISFESSFEDKVSVSSKVKEDRNIDDDDSTKQNKIHKK